jgi:hypothetical protein
MREALKRYKVYCDDIYVDDLMYMVNNEVQSLVYDKQIFLIDHLKVRVRLSRAIVIMISSLLKDSSDGLVAIPIPMIK